jgi:3-demethoxyubiquinol 3-hydroxylase
MDAKAHAAVVAIVHEEREHHDRAALEARQGGFWPRVLMPIVSVHRSRHLDRHAAVKALRS